MRWAAATALIRLAALDKAPVGPGLIGRAVTALTAAARSPFDRVTDYCEGDLHGHIQRTLRSLPPGSSPASVREALEACLPRIVRDSSGSRTRRAIQELFPAPLPYPAPRTPVRRPDSGAAAVARRSLRPPARLAHPLVRRPAAVRSGLLR
ncbi:hypothetical protein AB0O32_23840 [Streptomyces rubiginosohelvolus]|uniref:hypothetical protein n=1 Tax=Streptomyces rubiginosohelvolus TaxID=67362 RepID=UPI0034322325